MSIMYIQEYDNIISLIAPELDNINNSTDKNEIRIQETIARIKILAYESAAKIREYEYALKERNRIISKKIELSKL